MLGIDNFNDYYSQELKRLNTSQLKQKGINIKTADLAEDDLNNLLTDINYIYYLAAQPGISSHVSFETYHRNNIHTTFRLLEASKSSKSLKGFINIATSSMYGKDATDDESIEPQPTYYYGITKLAAEQLVLASTCDQEFSRRQRI